MLDNHLLR